MSEMGYCGFIETEIDDFDKDEVERKEKKRVERNYWKSIERNFVCPKKRGRST